MSDVFDTCTVNGETTIFRVARPKFTGSKALAFMQRQPWAMLPDTLQSLGEIVARHACGIRVEQPEIDRIVAMRDARLEERYAAGGRSELLEAPQEPGALYHVVDRVAVIPITGAIVKYANQVNGVSQPRGTSMDRLKRQVRAAARAHADGEIDAILLDVDSPGGSVEDVPETADLIGKIGRKVPVFALADASLMASAAYWLAAPARQILATRSSEFGSIGVWTMLVDVTEALGAEGVKVTVVRSGPRKALGLPGEVVSDAVVAEAQRRVGGVAEMFFAAVKNGRRLDAKRLDAVIDGAVHMAADARKLGLIDEIVPDFDAAIARIKRAVREPQEDSDSRTSAHVGAALSVEPVAGEEAMTDDKQPAQPRKYASADEFIRCEPQLAAEVMQVGARQERARIQAIHALAESGQHEIVERCVATGADENTALKALHADLRSRRDAQLERNRSEREPVGQPDGTEITSPDTLRDSFALEGGGTGEFEASVLRDWQANRGGCRQIHGGQFVLYAAARDNERARAALKGGV